MSEACSIHSVNVHPEDVAGVLARLALVGRQLHAAGLASPADQHLRLDHHRIANLTGCVHRGLDARHCQALGHPQSVTGEQLLALVLQQVHAARDSSGTSASACKQARRGRRTASRAPVRA
jgi:hypothetical protein